MLNLKTYRLTIHWPSLWSGLAIGVVLSLIAFLIISNVNTDSRTRSISRQSKGQTTNFSAPTIQNDNSETVYATAHGKKYHRAGCSSVRSNAMQITINQAKQKGLQPCSRCKPNE